MLLYKFVNFKRLIMQSIFKKYIQLIQNYFLSFKNPTILYDWTHEGLKKSHEICFKKFQKIHSDRIVKKDGIEYDRGFNIVDDEGYKIINLKQSKVLTQAVKHCRKNFSANQIISQCSNESKQDTLLSMSIDLNNDKNKIIRDLAISPDIIGPVSHYLGSVPILFGSYVWFSPNDKKISLLGSQLFHFDREDIKQIKCFIPIEDIDEQSGPLNVMPAKYTQKFMQYRKDNKQDLSLKQRFTDEEVFNVVGKDKVVKMTGKMGDVVFVDTTNCLHYGSRYASKPKYHITLHYISAFSRKLYNQNAKILKADFNQNGNLEEMLFEIKR